MAKKKKPTGRQAGDRLAAGHGNHSTSAAAQRARLLAALQRGPIDTVHAYRVLDILHVPRRVFELRQAGHDIRTSWIQRYTEAGIAHRVGLYSLLDGRRAA